MRTRLAEVLQEIEEKAKPLNGIRIGKLIETRGNKEIIIDFPENLSKPLNARSLVQVRREDKGRSLLLMFENSDPNLPIIVGFLHDNPIISSPSEGITLKNGAIKELFIDGDRIVFNAKKEIVLNCGKGSVTIRKDGKVVLKGTNLISRSSGPNKIKGASVTLN